MTPKLPGWLPCGVLLFGLACSASDAGDGKRPGDFQADDRPAIQTAASADAGPGADVVRRYCVLCHGADGKLGLNGAKDLTASQLTREQRIDIITNGKKTMTPFGEILTPEEIQAVADYTLTLKK